jgi:hypothetical protein
LTGVDGTPPAVATNAFPASSTATHAASELHATLTSIVAPGTLTAAQLDGSVGSPSIARPAQSTATQWVIDGQATASRMLPGSITTAAGVAGAVGSKVTA